MVLRLSSPSTMMTFRHGGRLHRQITPHWHKEKHGTLGGGNKGPEQVMFHGSLELHHEARFPWLAFDSRGAIVLICQKFDQCIDH